MRPLTAKEKIFRRYSPVTLWRYGKGEIKEICAFFNRRQNDTKKNISDMENS